MLGLLFLIALFVLFPAALFVLFQQRRYATRLWKPYHWLVFTHLLLVVAAFAVGTIYGVRDPHHRQVSQAGVVLLQVVTYGSFASCAFWIWRMKGFREYAGVLLFVLEMPVLVALLLSGMAVSGVWI